ncbi:MAG TPA: BamA/TamA family outer membrane protein [Vicinamibacterales bacterium]
MTNTVMRVGRTAAVLAILATSWATAVSAQEARPLGAAQPRLPEHLSEPQGFVIEPGWIERAVLFGDRRLGNGELKEGWYIDRGSLIPGAGWLAGGPGYRWWLSDDRIVADASAAFSWHAYRSAQARIEAADLAGGRLLAGSQIRWQDFPQVKYYGQGPGTLEAHRSQYGFQSTNLVGYALFKPARWLGVGASAGWLAPSVTAPGGFFEGDDPDARVRFASDPGFGLADQPSFIHAEASVTADTRDFANRPTSGGLYRAAAANFSDRDTGAFSFRRYQAEAAQFVPMADSRLVLALHGWLVASGADDVVPFYLQPSLGGHNSLRGHAEYRFHDRNMLLATVEMRAAMMTHVDLALFADAGNVAARAGDLNLDKRSYGAGLRLHSRRQTFARLDLARGSEGWRLFLRLEDPLALARLAKRTAPAPFVH